MKDNEQGRSYVCKKYGILRYPYFIIILLVAFYVSMNFYRVMLIQGNSMKPTYSHMQIVLLDVWDRTYSYGDVIAFSCREVGETLVKRVAAVPGDRVQIIEGSLYVNQQRSVVFSQETAFRYAGLAENEIHLGEAEYFVIGDNITESVDSRYKVVGIIKEEDIKGKIFDKNNDLREGI